MKPPRAQASARGSPAASWPALLRQAVTTPGLVHDAYHRFHQYSLRNQLLAMVQCLDRGIMPGPLATYKEWERLGRHVLRGQKALILCMPMTGARARPRGPEARDEKDAAENDEAAEHPKNDEGSRVFFAYRARWFVLAQTDGDPYEAVSAPSWSEEQALTTLGITRAPFAHLDGNAQGYATGNREVAISPVAALPHKTLFHEVAHVLLDHANDNTVPRSLREVEAEGVALLCCEALGLDGAECARGYLQDWLQHDELTDEMAQRIISTAHRILSAGDQTGGEPSLAER